MSTVTTLLNNAFSQRQISTIYESLNQYQVVMEIDPSYAQYPEVLEQIHVVTGDGRRCRWRPSPITSAAWRKIGSATMGSSPPRTSTSTRPRHQPRPCDAGHRTRGSGHRTAERGAGRLGGTGSAFQTTQEGQPLMILGALLLVYIVLGILYESYIHPLTILLHLALGRVGALLAIILTGDQFSLICCSGCSC